MLGELEIINAMLRVNSEAPVSNVNSSNPEVIDAKSVLSLVSGTVQKVGYWFNKEVLTLAPTIYNEIILPSNTLSIDPFDVRKKYVQRGSKLYDPVNNTYNITESVKCIIVFKLPIEEIPHVAADYIRHKAVLEYYEDADGDPQKVMKLEGRVRMAYSLLRAEDLKNRDINIYNSPMGAELMVENLSSRYSSSYGRFN